MDLDLTTEPLQENFWTIIGQIDGSDVEGLSSGFLDHRILPHPIFLWDEI